MKKLELPVLTSLLTQRPLSLLSSCRTRGVFSGGVKQKVSGQRDPRHS